MTVAKNPLIVLQVCQIWTKSTGLDYACDIFYHKYVTVELIQPDGE